MLCGLYVIKVAITCYNKLLSLDKKPNLIFPLFWSIFLVLFVLNLLFIITELYLMGGWLYP